MTDSFQLREAISHFVLHKSVVTITHKQNFICSKTYLDAWYYAWADPNGHYHLIHLFIFFSFFSYQNHESSEVNQSLRWLRTEEFPDLENFMQSIKRITTRLATVNIPGHVRVEQVMNTVERLSWMVKLPTVMESIAICDNWWRETTTKGALH